MTADEVRRLLKRQCDKSEGQNKWAKAHDLSAVYVSDVLAGRKEPAGKLLAALGLERVVTYRKAKR